MLLIRYVVSIAVLAIAAPASATLYQITGDLIATGIDSSDNPPTNFIVGKVGEFELIIDDTDIVAIVNNIGNTTPQTTTTAPLINEPWFGYNVQSVSFTSSLISFNDTADLATVGPFDATGPGEAPFYIEGGSLADLASGAISGEDNIAFSFQTTLDGGFARVGNPTSGGDPTVFNVILNQFDFSDGTDFFGGVNILPNGGTQNVVVTLLVPEPSSFTLLMTLVGVLSPRRRYRSLSC